MPDLYHPVTDQTVSVSDKQARLYRRSGWVDVSAAEPTEASEQPNGPLEADLTDEGV